jgi:hypothetical protein
MTTTYHGAQLHLRYDLPATINLQSEPVPFVDGSNIITSHPEMDYFQNHMKDIFISSKSKDNKFISSIDKADVMKFGTNSKTNINLNIGYDSKTIFYYILVSYFQLHN